MNLHASLRVFMNAYESSQTLTNVNMFHTIPYVCCTNIHEPLRRFMNLYESDESLRFVLRIYTCPYETQQIFTKLNESSRLCTNIHMRPYESLRIFLRIFTDLDASLRNGTNLYADLSRIFTISHALSWEGLGDTWVHLEA